MVTINTIQFPKVVTASQLYRVEPELDLGDCVIPVGTTITLINGQKFNVVVVPQGTRCARSGMIITQHIFRFPKGT